MTERQWEKMTDRELKLYAQAAVAVEYGFRVPLCRITLLEGGFCDDNPQYVRFTIGGHEYSYDGITMDKRT